MSETSKNARAEALLGRRLSNADQARGVIALDCPCELGYWCPSCKQLNDEWLQWSEYRAMLWCERCNFDWPSALCVPINTIKDESRQYVNAGREDAARIFLETIEAALENKETT